MPKYSEDMKEMSKEEFSRAILTGIPDVLPQPKPYEETVNHAPKRKDVLTESEKVLALKNALRYFPVRFHAELAPEFASELARFGRIYMYRFRPDYKITARPIGDYPCRSRQAAAIMLMLTNNLDDAVAQHPRELIVYGGNGAAFQNWAQYLLTMKYLATMTDEQTLVLYSGHPLGLFPSHKEAPRLVITNGMVVPNYSSKDDWERMNALGISQYGQMTAGSFMYIGPQGIVHGTTITILNAKRKQQSKGASGKSVLFVSSGLGGMSGAQPKAGTIAGVVSVIAINSIKQLKGAKMPQEIVFCKGGGCTAKLGPDLLSHVLAKLPRGEKDSNLLIGYDSCDDAAVYKISDDTAVVQTLDFFPPMVDDPYTFGQIAAANALSDIYAMGGTVKTALNIVCFPEKMDLNILGKIMQGGADKVIEAGGTLAGGHSIADSDVKYGLSVMGTVHPEHIYSNNTGQPSDVLILTKKLGVGLVCNANRVGEAPLGAIEDAVSSMTTLNKAASEISHAFDIHACTDVTGFSFLGHLSEMLNDDITALIDSISIPVITGALRCADEFFLTAAAQRNRNHVGDKVCFAKNIPFSMEEVLFDPQTSGGLLFAVKATEADEFLHELKAAGLPAAKVGRFVKRCDVPIYVN
jgi:selenide,water dikinase